MKRHKHWPIKSILITAYSIQELPIHHRKHLLVIVDRKDSETGSSQSGEDCTSAHTHVLLLTNGEEGTVRNHLHLLLILQTNRVLQVKAGNTHVMQPPISIALCCEAHQRI